MQGDKEQSNDLLKEFEKLNDLVKGWQGRINDDEKDKLVLISKETIKSSGTISTKVFSIILSHLDEEAHASKSEKILAEIQ